VQVRVSLALELKPSGAAEREHEPQLVHRERGRRHERGLRQRSRRRTAVDPSDHRRGR
jgi:hypothetical protein